MKCLCKNIMFIEGIDVFYSKASIDLEIIYRITKHMSNKHIFMVSMVLEQLVKRL